MSEMPAHDQAELEMLREFFDCWIAFHAIERNARQDHERAAQRMVDAANSIKNFRALQTAPAQGAH